MLVSKKPYVVEARQNLTSKNPHFTLKTGGKFPQTSRLKSLIFIVEKYGKKLLFNFSDKKNILYFTLLPLRGETSVNWFTLRVASLCVGLSAGCPCKAWVAVHSTIIS